MNTFGLSAGNWIELAMLLLGAMIAWFTIKAKVEKALEKAEDAEKAAIRLQQEMHNFQLEVATQYATNEAIKQVEQRVVDAINRLTGRLDSFLTRASNPSRDKTQ